MNRMIQAGYDYARNLDTAYTSRSQNKTSVRRVKRTYQKVNVKKKILIKTGIFLFVYALLLVFLCMKSATLGYQIVELKKDVQNLETANKRLEYKIAEKSSLERVEQVATQKLGMYKPDQKSSIKVALQPEAINPVNKSNTPSQAKTDEKLLEKFYHSLVLLAQKDNN